VVHRGTAGSETKSKGFCRISMERPAIFHMGLEIWGGKDGWVEQMVNVSAAFNEAPNDLVAMFEDNPYFYWRLCNKKNRTRLFIPEDDLYKEVSYLARLAEELSLVKGRPSSCRSTARRGRGGAPRR
jgi:hypothetical protein